MIVDASPNTPSFTKAEAIAIFDGSQSELARVLGISRQAVGLWPDGKIPILRAYQLAEFLAKVSYEYE